MAVEGAQVSVGITATELTGTQTDTLAGQSVVARLPSGAPASVFLGGTGVTTTTGFELTAGSSVAMDLSDGERLFGIIATGTQTVHMLRTGV